MGKTEKYVILYRNGKLPENLSDILGKADENDLRILTAAMMLADGEGEFEPSSAFGELLAIDVSEVNASLKFWKGTGLISPVRGAKVTREKKNEENINNDNEGAQRISDKVGTAHKNGAVAHSSIAPYETAELADLLEKRRTLKLFIDEAQRVLGKTVNYRDTSLLVGIIDQLGFDEEGALAILAYAVRLKKATVGYAEKIAINFYDEGIVEAEAVIQKINAIEAAAETVTQIRSLFGLGSRALSTSEKKLFTSWSEKLGYGIDVIRMAYDITIDKIHEPAPKYVNGILESWYADGLYTAADIEQYISSQKSGANAKGGYDKSYDTDDFFEASLRRSYEEFDKKYGTDN